MAYSRSESVDFKRFFVAFFTTKAGPAILVLGLLVSMGMFCIVGIVPDIVSDRYARLDHGYSGPHCSDFDRLNKPDACQHGADDAQSAAALSSLGRNLLTLGSNSLVGSVSDARGRRGIMIACMFLSITSPFVLILMQLVDEVNPFWFYIADSSTGLVNWLSISFTMISDVMPEHWRAPSFGLLLAAFYMGFSVAPSFALIMSHFYVSLVAFSLMMLGFAFAVFALPETLPCGVAEHNLSRRNAELPQDRMVWVTQTLLRPFREISILNRDTFFRLLSAGSFFSGMVYSSDATLVLYYVEDQLNVRDGDLASMFFVMGVVGIVIQGLLLQFLVACLGEKGLAVTAFVAGTFHNLIYGLAKTKSAIYVAFCLSQLTKTNFPILSSMAANNVDANEQGRVQGALFALSALANAIGPVILEVIYNHTKDRKNLGPGTMFLVASLLYAAGSVFVLFIPAEKANAASPPRSNVDLSLQREQDDPEEALLDSVSETNANN